MGTLVAQIKSKLRNFCNYLYNRTNNHVLGRTCTSWGQLLVFYTIFYGVLTLIFSFHLAVFLILTPKPNVGITPWNFGKYTYSNYPNRKLDLILVPSSFTFNRRTGVAQLAATDFNRINRLLNSSKASGVNAQCLDKKTRFGYDTGQLCLYLHIAKVFEWTPELISPALKDSQWLNFICTFQLTHDDRGFPLILEPPALPLNLGENNSRSFPFTNEPDYKIPMMGLFVNLTALPEDFPSTTTGVIRCSLDFGALNMTMPALQALNRLYEIPSNATVTIKFQS